MIKMVKFATMLLMGIAVSFLLSGCVMTTGSYTPPAVVGVEQPTVRFYRFAILYPFAVESVTFPGGVKIGKYGSEGGAAGIVAIVDSLGNVYNTVKRP